jgi:hypothetical protein
MRPVVVRPIILRSPALLLLTVFLPRSLLSRCLPLLRRLIAFLRHTWQRQQRNARRR